VILLLWHTHYIDNTSLHRVCVCKRLLRHRNDLLQLSAKQCIRTKIIVWKRRFYRMIWRASIP